MSDLGTALRELARTAEPAGPAEAAELWSRGRARVRRRRAAAVAAVVLVLFLGAGIAAAGPEPYLVSPAGSPHAPGIPDRVEDPPGWLPVTPYGHRVGPLSVLGVGVRHGKERLFGIQASTGRYRFLDAGNRVPGTPVALSPDGRRVAYWSGHGAVTGLTLFDTTTGTMSGLDGGAETKLGLQSGPLTWLDDDTVLLEFGQRHQRGNSVVVAKGSWQTETFDARGGGPTVHVLDPNSGVWSRGRDGRLLVPLSTPDPGGQGVPVTFVGYDRSLDAVGTEFVLAPGAYGSVSRSGDTVVAVGYTGGQGHVGLLAGTVPALGGVTRLHDVGDLRLGTLLGWRSDHTVLVTGWQHAQQGRASLFEADVATGTVRRVGDAGDDVDVLAAVASDLLEKPFVAAHPPRGLDPTLVRSAAGGVLVLAVAGLLWWRRRGPA